MWNIPLKIHNGDSKCGKQLELVRKNDVLDNVKFFNIIEIQFQLEADSMSQEHFIFEDYLRSQGLKLTSQRQIILDGLLKAEKHLSVEDLYQQVKKEDDSIGQTTVFRTLKLLCEAGIAGQVDLGEKRVKYEIKFGHEHHDHLVCLKCGIYIEAMDPQIEKLQEKLCERFGFIPQRHRMEIYGVCKECQRKK